jgi:hypothetical protein
MPDLGFGPGPGAGKPDPQAAALRRKLSSDGFQAVGATPAPKVSLSGGGADTEYAKSIAGLTRRLLDHGPVTKEITEEMNHLVAVIPPPQNLAVIWQALVRLVLAPKPPSTPQEVANDSRTIKGTLAADLVKLPQGQSKALARLKEYGVSESDLFRGAHIVLVKRGSVYDAFCDYARPRAGNANPYPDSSDPVMELEIRGIGVMAFGRTADDDTWVQMETRVAELRKALPKLWAFYEQHVVKGQAVGPMGCSPRTLKSGNPVRVSR